MGTHLFLLPSGWAERARSLRSAVLLRGKERSYSPATQLYVFQAIPSSGEDVSSEGGGAFEQRQLLFTGTRLSSAL